MKRALDMIMAAVLLALLAPLAIVIAIIIKLDDRGPVFHLAARAGRGGVPFTMYKFRTMTTGAEKMGPAVTASVDARVTRAGSFLRASHLDELPQLLNVLLGDMSMVGPRPEDPVYVERYTPDQRRVLEVLPGLTGPSQLLFCDEAALLDAADPERSYVEEVMPKKLAVDVEYVENHSLAGDFSLLARTLLLPFGHDRSGGSQG